MGLISYEKLEGEEKVKLDELFGIKDSFVEVNPGKVLLPPNYEELGERVLNMKVRPDDVWLVSFPRTGSTWTQEMVWLIGNDLNYEGGKVIQQIRAPLLEYSAVMKPHHPDWVARIGDTVNLIESLPSPRYIKSHLPFELLPKQLETVKPKIVYVARNPKDMCVSFYHHCRHIHNLNGSFEEFCDLFLRDKAPMGPIWNHVLGFWRKRNEANVMFVTYEDMKRDQQAAIRRTAAFLGKTLTEEQVAELATYLSFNKMKDNPAVNIDFLLQQAGQPAPSEEMKFIRKGQVGDFKNHMTPELIARFDKWTEENLHGTGLTFGV